MKKLNWLLIIVLLFSVFGDTELFAKRKYYGVNVRTVSVKRVPALPSEAGVRGAMWVDDIIGIAWTVNPKKFSFRIGNRNNSPMKILWDECRFHDADGNRREVLHKEVKFIAGDMSPYQTPTLIKPGKIHRNHIAPIMFNLQDVKRIKAQYKPLYIGYKEMTKKIRKSRKNGAPFDAEAYAEKQRYTIELVLELDGQIYRYFFNFQGKLDN